MRGSTSPSYSQPNKINCLSRLDNYRIVANIQLAATCKVDYYGHPKGEPRPVQRLSSIKPSSYTCEGCNNTFASWKEAKGHLKS